MMSGCQPLCLVADKKNTIVKAKFMGNKSKCWCWHYSIAVVLCNQILLYNENEKQKKNKTPVTIIGTGTVNDMCPYGEQKLLFFGEFSGVDMLQM